MRVAVVHSFYTATVPSGENRVVLDQVEALRRAGHDVLLVSRHTDDLSNGRLYPMASSWRAATGLGADPLTALRHFKPDVVQVHNLFPNFGTSWVQEWSGPVLLTIHNYRAVCANGMLFRNGKQCTECIDHSNWRAITHGCYRESRLATIPVAIGLDRRGRDLLGRVSLVVTTSAYSDELIRRYANPVVTRVIPNFGYGEAEEPGSSTSRSGWVAMGRLSPEKGFVRLVEQWPTDVHLTVIGEGSQSALVDRYSRNAQVNMLGTLPIDELRRLLPEFYGLVLPSLWPEVAPQVVVEAMRVGLPVVAYEGNCVADTVRTSGAGATYSDGATLRAALMAVESDLDRFSDLAVETFEREWTERSWIRRIEEAYATALEGSPLPSHSKPE